MILIDTNVLLRSAQPAHSHDSAAVAAVSQVRMRGYLPTIVPQIIYEDWVVATRPVGENGLGLSTSQADIEVSQIVDQFHLIRDDRAVFDHWRRLVVDHAVQGKNAHDTRLVAAMQRHGVTYILTFNAGHFSRFGEVVVVHPNDAASISVK
jgi:predicted nucleic acid-binding protein